MELNETSPALMTALNALIDRPVKLFNSGGGVMILTVVMEDGRELWLTRDVDRWMLGFYDFVSDPEDEGQVVHLILPSYLPGVPVSEDDPAAVALAVQRIFDRIRGL